MSELVPRAIRTNMRLGPADVVAIVAAVLSLLTFTVVLPSYVHLPW